MELLSVSYGKASAIRIPARLLCDQKKIHMATEKHKKGKDPITDAHNQAEKDMLKDPELSDPDPTDDLDEGELARKDNSDEEALDYLERPRHPPKGHSGEHEHGHSGEHEHGHSGEHGHGQTHDGKKK